MRILMFGWEFPPYNQGGLGTACQGLTSGLLQHGLEINFVLPRFPGISSSPNDLNLINAQVFNKKNQDIYRYLNFIPIQSVLQAYQTAETFQQALTELKKQSPSFSNIENKSPNLYGQNLYQEVGRCALQAHQIAREIPHDLIHAHDWMTYPAAETAQKISQKPFIAHVHATEFDRTGGNPNQDIYDLERRGLEKSDHIIAVSEYTKQKIIQNYGIPAHKINVVHNAVEQFADYFKTKPKPELKKDDKIVLFLGRITLQKGPDYFIEMAAKVIPQFPKVKFVMAGSGDMLHYMIQKAGEHRILDHVLFTGFLRGQEIDRVYQTADLYVMPSVSEPFGITPLEAIKNGTPVLISKQSGVSEIIANALKVDFWDIDEMANKVLAVLKYSALTKTLVRHSQNELRRISWKEQAGKIKDIYYKVIH